MGETESELKQLVRCCLENDKDARVGFQDLFGEFIYNYPMKMFRVATDNAADFYIYVFENDRVFKRLSGFEGRNGAHFRTYLGGFVLRDLFLEWQRSQKEPETVSLETIVTGNDTGEKAATLQDLIADPRDSEGTLMDSQDEATPFKEILAGLDMGKRVLLRLLHLAEFDLEPAEIRFICEKSGRAYKEVVILIEEIRIGLRKKDEQFASLQDQLESIFGWILLYQRELAKVTETLKSATEASSSYIELSHQREELERKLEWRYRQREQVLAKARQSRVTTPYKDIAWLLNVPLGTVCSLVARVRAELLEAFGVREVSKEAVA